VRIAFIAQRMVYPPDAGTPIRNLNLAVQAAANHHLTVYAYSEESLRPTPACCRRRRQGRVREGSWTC